MSDRKVFGDATIEERSAQWQKALLEVHNGKLSVKGMAERMGTTSDVAQRKYDIWQITKGRYK